MGALPVLITIVLLAGLVASFPLPAALPTPLTHQPGPAPSLKPVALPPQFTATVQHWAPEIQEWADAYGLPASWIAVVMQIESCGDPVVLSRAGAAGLFQVMPFHFASGEDPLDVNTNAARGLTYLSRAYTLASGELGPTLAGYNGGHGLITQPPELWPAETQRYVRWGTGILLDVEAGTVPSPALSEWLEAGGRRLCLAASDALGLPEASSSA
jgi:hypothetical protein